MAEPREHCPINLVGPFNHKFVIPVEWDWSDNHAYTGYGPGSGMTSKWVTKLRCECGDEIRRQRNGN